MSTHTILSQAVFRNRVSWYDFCICCMKKISVLYMNSPGKKQIFVGIFSYRLILDVIFPNYRRTIWNGRQYGMAYPFLIVHPCHIVPPLNCVSLWINLTSACVVWSNSTQSWLQEDMEKVYRAHSRSRPIPYCPKRYLGTACLDKTFASVVWRKTISIVHE